MKKIINYTTLLALMVFLFSACAKNNFNKFEGTYDLKSSGNINYFIGDTTFQGEPGLAIIKKGDKSDELFLYVETNFVTAVAPLGVYANARIDGKSYEMEPRSLAITIDLGGLSLPLNFVVNASGTLSKDNKTLTSEIEFSGGMNGTLSSVGTKRK